MGVNLLCPMLEVRVCTKNGCENYELRISLSLVYREQRDWIFVSWNWPSVSVESDELQLGNISIFPLSIYILLYRILPRPHLWSWMFHLVSWVSNSQLLWKLRMELLTRSEYSCGRLARPFPTRLTRICRRTDRSHQSIEPWLACLHIMYHNI